ncbi:hypothetical protein BJ944DRAFT_269045 [Cunninghamella echinulata]|nr:hypothetical protein BJ944DRAFT_269045 [Cunninghamella echinulata]
MTTYITSIDSITTTNDKKKSATFNTNNNNNRSSSKVNLELAKLKQLGKVSKKVDSNDGDLSLLNTTAPQHNRDSCTLNDNEKKNNNCNDSPPLFINNMDMTATENNKNHEEEEKSLLNIEKEYEEMISQLNNTNTILQEEKSILQYQLQEEKEKSIELIKEKDTLHDQLVASQQEIENYKLQFIQQEKIAQDTIAHHLQQSETHQSTIKKLIQVIDTQDQLIQLLTTQQEKLKELSAQLPPPQPKTSIELEREELIKSKYKLEASIATLKANIDTNHSQMDMIMMVSTAIQNDYDKHKLDMDRRFTLMEKELARKDDLLLQYQDKLDQYQLEEKKENKKKDSFITNSNNSITKEDGNDLFDHHHHRQHQRESSTRSSTSSSSMISTPPLYLSNSSSIITCPPASPPPTAPLPSIPPPSSSFLAAQYHHHQQQQQERPYQKHHLSSNYPQGINPSYSSSPSIPSLHHHNNNEPLMPVPTSSSSTSLDSFGNGKPFWKNMKKKWRNS